MNTRTSARYYDFDLNYNNQFNIEEKENAPIKELMVLGFQSTVVPAQSQ